MGKNRVEKDSIQAENEENREQDSVLRLPKYKRVINYQKTTKKERIPLRKLIGLLESEIQELDEAKRQQKAFGAYLFGQNWSTCLSLFGANIFEASPPPALLTKKKLRNIKNNNTQKLDRAIFENLKDHVP